MAGLRHSWRAMLRQPGPSEDNWVTRLKFGWRSIRPEFITGILFLISRTISASLRLKVVNKPECLERTILCGWHGRTFSFANFYRNQGIWVMISHSRDGEMQARVFLKFGFRIIRGSTGRGGARALAESIRVLRAGGVMAMTPDGPRGPTGIVQEGVMMMACRSGASLLPMAFSARPVVKTKSWDSYVVPIPFAKAVMLFGEPLTIPDGAGDEEVEAVRVRLQEEMHRLQDEADRMTGFM